jgi:exonuclease SbcD
MKILHTSDWHLGKSTGTISRHDEQVQVLAEIETIADKEQVDAVIIAGDLFDTFNPPVVSSELLYRTLKHLGKDGERIVVAIAGNHDSPERVEMPDALAKECGIVFVGYPSTSVSEFELAKGVKWTATDEGFLEVKLPRFEYPLRLILTPYANEQRLKSYLGAKDKEGELRQFLQEHWSELAAKYCNNKGVNVLVSHLFMVKKGDSEQEQEADDEKPILGVGGAQAVYTANLPQGLHYAGLGHLHRHFAVAKTPYPIVYSGSPLAYSMSEADQQKYASIIDAEPGKPAMTASVKIESGRRLQRKEFDSAQQAVDWLKINQGCLVELTLRTKEYISSEERRMLFDSHEGIVDIIPFVTATADSSSDTVSVNVAQSVPELFQQYFVREKGQKPNERILALLQEVLGEEEQ